MIYIGEHGVTTKDVLIQQMKKAMDSANTSYVDVPLCGLLLVYDSYFVHIVEGSEDTIHRHFRLLFTVEEEWKEEMRIKDEEEKEAAVRAIEDEAEDHHISEHVLIARIHEVINAPPKVRTLFKKMKILIVYHSITTRMFSGWTAYTARPPALVGKLDIYAPMDVHIEQLEICLEKISKLCKLVQEDESVTFEGLSANDPKMEGLPEVALLDYLIQSKHILDLRETMALHRRVDDHSFYFEQVWPLQTHYTPRYLYKLKIDDSFVEPLPVMWWEKKEQEEEGEKEDRSSDSD